MSYATPSEFWKYAAPPDSLFEESGFEPGVVGAVTATVTGLGSLVVSPTSDPRDAWSVKIKCVTAGELNSNYVNPGAEPTFQVSYDGGTTYFWQVLKPDAAGQLLVVKGGFSLLLANGTIGSPVTIGAGDASLIFTPLRAGGSVKIVVGTTLSHTLYDGALTLTVTGTTTATAAAAYLNGYSAVTSYMTIAAGGTGAGAVAAAALTALPFVSFAANDTWAFSTTPSPDIVSAIQVGNDLADGYLGDTYNLPLTAWGGDLTQAVCDIARWNLFKRRGLDKDQAYAVYEPKASMDWLDKVSKGMLKLKVTETPPTRSFPKLNAQIPPLSREADAFPI